MPTTAKIRLALLLCDDVNAAEQAEFGTYETMFTRAFAAAGAPVELQPVEVYRGEVPRVDAAVDGFLISGSRAAAYEQQPWNIGLQEFIRECYGARRKMVGVCFGHQVIAHALGGETRKAAVGWSIGAQRAQITAPQPWMHTRADAGAPPSEYKLIFLHQDQVVRLPPNFQIVAGNAACPVGMFVGADAAGAPCMLGIQSHPEFTPAYCRARLVARQAEVDADAYNQARASLRSPDLDAARVLRWLAQFLRA